MSGPGESFFDRLYNGLAFVRIELSFPLCVFGSDTLLFKRFEAQRGKTEVTQTIVS